VIDWINTLSDLLFVVFVLTVLLTVVQLSTLATHILRGSGASLIPGILAAVGAVVLFVSTH
jgi:hypothetical protein